jgi:hypothetical protein
MLDREGKSCARGAGGTSISRTASASILWGPWMVLLGEELMTITVGERPDNGRPFNETTDIAFGPNGRLYITDGYGNFLGEIPPSGGRPSGCCPAVRWDQYRENAG